MRLYIVTNCRGGGALCHDCEGDGCEWHYVWADRWQDALAVAEDWGDITSRDYPLTLYRKDVDHEPAKSTPHEERRDAVLRDAGCRFPGDGECEDCGRYEMNGAYPVCRDCGRCEECGCACAYSAVNHEFN